MNISQQRLSAISQSTGFRPEILEKVIQLVELLNAITAHPFLGPRLTLKGGTALNLFIFELPRLSVDIDLNYIGSAARDGMLADRRCAHQCRGPAEQAPPGIAPPVGRADRLGRGVCDSVSRGMSPTAWVYPAIQ